MMLQKTTLRFEVSIDNGKTWALVRAIETIYCGKHVHTTAQPSTHADTSPEHAIFRQVSAKVERFEGICPLWQLQRVSPRCEYMPMGLVKALDGLEPQLP